MRLDSRPAPIDLSLAETAVVVVDMQNHFVTPGGTWANCGVDTTSVIALEPKIAGVLAAARKAGTTVVHVVTALPPQPVPVSILPQAFRGTGIERWEAYLRDVGGAPGAARPMPQGASPTWNADVVTALAPQASDVVVTKYGFGAFHTTDLEARLTAIGVKTLLFTGCTTSVCVETTLREAHSRGFECVLLEDCVAEPCGSSFTRTNHDATVHLVELLFGWVSNSDSLLAALNEARQTLEAV